MNAIRQCAMVLMASELAFPVLASALDECVRIGDGAAVLRCLNEEEGKANADLSSAESVAAKRARALEQATGRAGAYAALAKSVHDFAAYRASQCAFIKEAMASGSGGAEAQVGCRIDLNRRRVRELKF